MMRYKLRIERDRIFDEVSKQGEWSAAKRYLLEQGQEAPTPTSVVELTGEDAQLLEQYWKDCTGQLAVKCRRWVSSVAEIGGGVFEAEIDVPSNWPASLWLTVESCATGFLVQSILGQWLQTASGLSASETIVASAAQALALASQRLTELIHALSARALPERPHVRREPVNPEEFCRKEDFLTRLIRELESVFLTRPQGDHLYAGLNSMDEVKDAVRKVAERVDDVPAALDKMSGLVSNASASAAEAKTAAEGAREDAQSAVDEAREAEQTATGALQTAAEAAQLSSAAQSAAADAQSTAADAQSTASAAEAKATDAATAASTADGKASAAQSAAAAAASAVSQLRGLLSEKADQSAVDELEQAGMELINGLAEDVQNVREKTEDLDSLKMSDLENDLLPNYRSAEKRNPLTFVGVLPLDVDRNVTVNTSYRDIQHPQVYYSPLKGAFGAWVGNVLYTRWSGWEEYVLEQYALYLNGETGEWWTVLDGRLVKGFHVQPVIDFLKPVLALRVHELQDTRRLMSGFWMDVGGDLYEVGEFREDNMDSPIEVYNTWGETLGENGDGGPCHYAMVELRTAFPMYDRWPLLLSNEDGDAGDFRRIFKDSQLNLDNMTVESDDIVLSRLLSRKPGHTDRKFKHWVPYKRYAVGELNSYRDEYTAIGRSINLSKTDEVTGEGVDKTEDLFALKEIDSGMTKMLPISSLLQFFPVNIPEREIPGNLVYLCPSHYIEPGDSAEVLIHMANVGTGERNSNDNSMIVNLWQRASLHREVRFALNDQEGNGGTFTVRGEPVTGRLWLKSIKQRAMCDIEDGLEGSRLILSLEFVADR